MTRTVNRYRIFRNQEKKTAFSLINAQVNDFIKNNGIKQREVAEQCNISEATISSSMNYRRHIPKKKLLEILLYLSEKYDFKIRYKNGIYKKPYNSLEENIEKFRLNDNERLKQQ
jgi:predicted XRE-type DNA-binding protein